MRAVEKQALFNPHEEPVSRSDDDRRLDVQIPPCDFDSNLADLLSDRRPYLLPVAGLCENRGILPLLISIPAANSVGSACVPFRQCCHDGRLPHAALSGDRKDDTLGFQFQGRAQSSLLPTKTLGLKTFVGCNRDSLWRFTSASRSSLAISSSLRICHSGFSLFPVVAAPLGAIG